MIKNNEIDIATQIGENMFTEGYTFRQFLSETKNIENELAINIHTYGGDLAEALAIFDRIKSMEQKVVTRVLGVGASSGTIISIAGDQREISENASYLIHRPTSIAEGTIDDFEKAKTTLNEFEKRVIKIYAENSNLSEKDIFELMKQDKFISAEMAINYGFCDNYVKAKSINKQKAKKMTNQSTVLEQFGVKSESELFSKIEKMKAEQDKLQRFKNEKEEEEKKKLKEDEEMKEKEKDDKIKQLEKQVDDLKAKLEEQKEQETKNLVDNAIPTKFGKEAQEMLMNIGMTQGNEVLKSIIDNAKGVDTEPKKPNLSNFKQNAQNSNMVNKEQLLAIYNKKKKEGGLALWARENPEMFNQAIKAKKEI